VPEFIDLLLADWYEPSEAALMLKGLDAIDEMAGGSFVALDPAGREAIAARLDPLGGGDPGTAPWAWRRVKSLTVYGYFTSERVVNEVLGEPAIPGEFRGCAERRAP
jgi:hypothetical protein